MARTSARRQGALHRRMRRPLAAFSALCLLGGILTVSIGSPASAAIPASFFVVKDQNGPNDQPGQVDLSELGRDTTTDPSRYDLFWSWDSTGLWTGTGQTGDACALFDYDGDGNVDAVICGEVHNPNADPSKVVQTFKPFAFRCVDSKNDRCSQPTASLPYSGTDVLSGPVGVAPTGNDLTSNLISGTDPFLTGDDNPNDAVLRVSISKAYLQSLAGDLGSKYKPISGADPTLVNVCSYPSAGNGGNNNPFDCIAAPGSGFLVINKNADGAGTFPFTVNPVPTGQPSSFSVTTPSGGGTVSTDAIGLLDGTGTEAVTETIPTGWTLTGVSCLLQNGTTATGTATSTGITGVTIESGKTTTCTFTDRKIQAPTLQTDVTGGSAGGTFTAHGSDTVPAGSGINDTVKLTGSAGTVTGTVDYNLYFLPGAPPASFATACSGTPFASELGKALVNGAATSQSVSTTAGKVGTYVWQDVYHPAAGSQYSGATETCGDEKVTAVEGRILVTPHSDTDPVGDTHTLTTTVQWTDPSLASSTTWPSTGIPAAGAWAPVSGALVSFSLNAGTHASFVGAVTSCTTSSAGTCTVAITDATAETVTIHASSTFTVSGVHGSFARSTTVGAGCTENTCDATKIFVPIPPTLLTDVTGGSAGGTFTAHGTDTVPAGTAINDTVQLTGSVGPVTGTVDFNVYFLPGAPPSSFATACSGTPFATDLGKALVNGVATSQAISTTAGKVGTYVWQDVYHPAAGSPYSGTTETCGDETVIAVEARLLLTPHSASDAVGDTHTLTATVQWTDPALATSTTWPSTGTPAGGSWGPVSGATVSFTLNSGTHASFVNGTSTCATSSAGACAVQITDATAETVTIHAFSTFPVTGVHGTFTRSTTVGGPCVADTCDATKTFYAAPTTLTVTDRLVGLPQVANGTVGYRSYSTLSACTSDTTNTGGTNRTPASSAVAAGSAPSSTSVSVTAGTEVWFRATYTTSGTDHIGSFTTGCVERAAS